MHYKSDFNSKYMLSYIRLGSHQRGVGFFWYKGSTGLDYVRTLLKGHEGLREQLFRLESSKCVHYTSYFNSKYMIPYFRLYGADLWFKGSTGLDYVQVRTL